MIQEGVAAGLCLLSAWLLLASCQLESCSYNREEVLRPILSSSSARRQVDQELGVDSVACLNGSVACRSLHYALHQQDDVELRSNVINLVVHLSAGIYVLTGSQQIINSMNVAIIGAGAEQTVFNCGEFGDTDRVCDYMNFQIRNSTRVYVTEVTFTRCGPITSSVYVAFSNNIYFENCVFRDTLSPSMLIHNTETIVLVNCTFANNHPRYLPPNITRDICYFSGGEDIFFVDNRTTSGGISFYIQDLPATFLLINCTFSNNTARPDDDVSLVRRSDTYGHGGALNVRLLHSSNSVVCIQDSSFIDNSAQAHGGGMVLSLAGDASLNHFAISKTLFDRNFCTADKCTGGAVGLDLLAGSQYNVLEISESNFTGNRANASGAISISTSVSAKVGEGGVSDTLILRKCLFTKNEAFF